jgi:hypothetical protein
MISSDWSVKVHIPSESSGLRAQKPILKGLVQRGTIMDEQTVNFRIANLSARVPEGIALEWQGKEFDSGPLIIELDKNASFTGNQGTLDYFRSRARAEFQVRLMFPEFAGTLEDLGLDPEFARPVRALIHAEGKILADHSFALSGPCDLSSHALFIPEETKACVLPGR